MRKNSIQQFVVLTATALLAACGDGVEGTGYKGVPLAKLSGTLSAQSVSVPSAVRLALAWYPFENDVEAQPGGSGGSPVTQPKSIVTQDVVYQGSFPLSFTFDVYDPPPASALRDYSANGGPQGAAVGLLLAYEDVNGNGKLDVIPGNGAPIDKVVGASADFLPGKSGPVAMAAQYAVLYIQGPVSADWEIGNRPLVSGFNLVRLAAESEDEEEGVVPLSTPITIQLQDNPRLNLLVCDALFNPETVEDTLCGIEVFVPSPDIYVDVNVLLIDGTLTVGVYLTAAGHYMTNAEVSLGGELLAYDTATSAYHLTDSTGAIFRPGETYELNVNAGDTGFNVGVTLPGAFDIVAPSANAQITTGADFIVNWTASSGVTNPEYRVIAGCNGAQPQVVTVQALSATIGAPAQACEGEVQVTVVNIQEMDVSANIVTSVGYSRPVTFVP